MGACKIGYLKKSEIRITLMEDTGAYRGYGGYSRDEGNAGGGDGGYSMWANSGISSGLDSNPYNTYGGRSDACAVSDPTPF